MNGITDVDLVVANGVVMTMDRERRILADGGVAVLRGRIEEVGRSREILAKYRPRKHIDAAGGFVLPGFVDAHVHLSQHLGRGVIPDTWPEEREHEHWLPYWTSMSEKDDYYSGLLACMEMVRNGTTTFCEMGGRFRGELSAESVEKVGLRSVITENIWDNPPYASVAVGDTDECVHRLERLIEALPKRDDLRYQAGIGVSGMGRCSDRLLIEAARLADEHDLMMTMHQSFGPQDVEDYREHSGGKTAVEHFADLGILGRRLVLVHMIYTEEIEVRLLAESGTNVVHCPAASTRVGMGVSHVGRFPEMIQTGVNVALGSDSGNYSDYLDVGRQAYLAATIHREARQETPAITAEQALEMATLNGARALGLSEQIGSLEPGKRADIVVYDSARPELHPGLYPPNTLIYSSQSTAVSTVIVDGEVICEGGKLTRVDERTELAAVDRAARELHDRMGFRPARTWPVVE